MSVMAMFRQSLLYSRFTQSARASPGKKTPAEIIPRLEETALTVLTVPNTIVPAQTIQSSRQVLLHRIGSTTPRLDQYD
jgi:hypothetical protein